MRLILCPRCRRRRPHHARNLCASCYVAQYCRSAVMAFRASPEYGERRKAYDDKYLLKSCGVSEDNMPKDNTPETPTKPHSEK